MRPVLAESMDALDAAKPEVIDRYFWCLCLITIFWHLIIHLVLQ